MNKEHLIKSSRDFDEIIKNGKLTKNLYLKVFKKNNEVKTARFGISVPKANGNAVLRNKVRRQVKEILRHEVLSAIEPADYVIIINKRFISLNISDKILVLKKIILKEL